MKEDRFLSPRFGLAKLLSFASIDTVRSKKDRKEASNFLDIIFHVSFSEEGHLF